MMRNNSSLVWFRPMLIGLFFLTDKWEISLVSLRVFLYYSFSFSSQKKNSKFELSLSWITLFLVGFFLSPGFGFLYLTFELSLIPILYIIIHWGYQPERLRASFYISLYTIAGSLPLLMLIVKTAHSSFDFTFPYVSGNLIWFLCGVLAFLVKIPIWGFHLWLPKAHVEAPVVGSMILAGVLLKLGGFGLLKIWSRIAVISTGNNLVLAVSFWSLVVLPLICLLLVDAKVLIAYSSIIHIALIIGGILRGSLVGFWGAFWIILAHGFTSPLIFFLANKYYEPSFSRNLLLQKGLNSLNPLLAFLWFLALIHSIAAPPSLRIFREILICFRFLKISLINLFFIGFSVFFGGAIRLYLFSAYMGSTQSKLLRLLSNKEKIVSYLILLPIRFWLGFSY